MKIGVLGPGAVGSLVAALFWRSGYQVVCVGTHRAVESIRKDGIKVQSAVYGDFVALPDAGQLLLEPVDVLFVAVKSPFLVDALASVANEVSSSTAVVSLLNGLGHREEMRRQLGLHVVVGTIGAVEVALSDTRAVQHRSSMRPHIDIASDRHVAKEMLQRIVLALEGVGLSARIGQSENDVIWRKLVRLCAIGAMTTYSRMPLGRVRSDPALRSSMRRVVDEVTQVALLEGVDVRADQVMRQIDGLPETLTTSLQRDVASGSTSEIEAIVGGVLRLGREHGLLMPTLQSTYSSIWMRLGR
jgi:2-dehydropantoate 2-reductase